MLVDLMFLLCFAELCRASGGCTTDTEHKGVKNHQLSSHVFDWLQKRAYADIKNCRTILIITYQNSKCSSDHSNKVLSLVSVVNSRYKTGNIEQHNEIKNHKEIATP